MSRSGDERETNDLLEAVQDVARKEQREAEEWWEAVERGDRSSLPEAAPAVEDLRPLDDEERARMTESLFGVAPAKEEPPPAPLIDLERARRRRRSAWGAVVAGALAAGLAALVVTQRGAGLPEYAIEARAGERALRGEADPSGLPRYTGGSLLTIVLRPAEAVPGEVDVASVLVPKTGAARAVEMDVEPAPGGALRLTAVLGATFDAPPGRYRLVFLVAPKGGLPADPVAARGAPPDGGRRLQHEFEIVTVTD